MFAAPPGSMPPLMAVKPGRLNEGRASVEAEAQIQGRGGRARWNVGERRAAARQIRQRGMALSAAAASLASAGPR